MTRSILSHLKQVMVSAGFAILMIAIYALAQNLF